MFYLSESSAMVSKLRSSIVSATVGLEYLAGKILYLVL